MPFLFEKLDVYQKSVTFAEQVTRLTKDFPRGSYFLSDQLNRSAVSIAANIAEGNGRFTKADRKNFFGIARGSVHECVPLIEICRRRELLGKGDAASLIGDLEHISRMLSGLINGLKERG